jgi:hypothetical protein
VRYVGPPVCRRKSTWEFAPFCDGCGVVVSDFRVWESNARHCSPECRPDWHLVPGRACGADGCSNRVLVGSGRGRPVKYCSDECRRWGEAEDQRRRREGSLTRAQEARLMDLIFGDSGAWLSPGWVADAWDGMSVERREPVKGPGSSVGRLSAWLAGGGDWPGLVPGVSRPVADTPVLGSWEPWDRVS